MATTEERLQQCRHTLNFIRQSCEDLLIVLDDEGLLTAGEGNEPSAEGSGQSGAVIVPSVINTGCAGAEADQDTDSQGNAQTSTSDVQASADDVHAECLRQDFASRCLPDLDISPRDACSVLNYMINHNKRHAALREALIEAGYQVRGKRFTARQAEILTEYINAHPGCVLYQYHAYLNRLIRMKSISH